MLCRLLFIIFGANLLILFFSSSAAGAQSINKLKEKYKPIVQKIAQNHGIEPDLIHSIISAESNYDRWAVSVKGASGLMQLMPETAKEYGVKNIYDAKENIEGGVKYLKDLIQLYNGKTRFVLAAYNAGQEAVKKFGGIPPYPETKNYINKIMASYAKQTVKSRTKIYRFYDSSGKLVLTNDPYFYSLNEQK